MGNGGLGLGLDLREEIKGEDQGDKREEKEREKNFCPLKNPGEKEKRKKTREKGERREILAKNQHLLKRKRGDLTFQKSSYTQIISEGEVRSLISVYNK